MEQLQNTPLKSRRGGRASRLRVKFLRVKLKAKGTGVPSVLSWRLCHGGCIIKRGNFLCADYASTRGYASNLRLKVPVFVVFCHGGCIIERGNF